MDELCKAFVLAEFDDPLAAALCFKERAKAELLYQRNHLKSYTEQQDDLHCFDHKKARLEQIVEEIEETHMPSAEMRFKLSSKLCESLEKLEPIARPKESTNSDNVFFQTLARNATRRRDCPN